MVAILSAYVRPRVDQYLAQLERELGAVGVRVPLYITKSNGGVTTARDARQATAETMLSGPASGVIGRPTSASEPSTRACPPDQGDVGAGPAHVEGDQSRYPARTQT